MPLITVTGTVSSFQSGQYPNVKLWETFQVRGNDKFRLWTAWTDVTLNVQEGDTITVTGELGTKVDNYTKQGIDPTTGQPYEARSTVAHSLNNTTLDAHSPKEPLTAQKATTTPTSGYNAVSDLSTPF